MIHRDINLEILMLGFHKKRKKEKEILMPGNEYTKKSLWRFFVIHWDITELLACHKL